MGKRVMGKWGKKSNIQKVKQREESTYQRMLRLLLQMVTHQFGKSNSSAKLLMKYRKNTV